jgi:nucleoside-triphosphatase THEP1
MKQVYLLTGKPGTGKTSLIKQAIAGMKGKAGGFYTEEIRSQGVRQGFRLVTLAGDTAILAHIGIRSPYRVSKYGVDVDGLERVGVSALHQAAQHCGLVVVDEIGKMELFSTGFREAVLQIIGSGKRVLGTIMLAANPWADAIKLKPQVNIIEVTRANHHEVLEELVRWLKAMES